MANKVNREYVTAISISRGIITLIEPDGTIAEYRQRGITRLSPQMIYVAIVMGALDSNWAAYRELPKHYSISFEDEDIMGRASASFPIKKLRIM